MISSTSHCYNISKTLPSSLPLSSYYMGKLRDWWPSDEPHQLQHSRSRSSSSTDLAAGTAAATTAPLDTNGVVSAPLSAAASAVTLRLSEVAAALNAMPNHPPSATSTAATVSTPTPISEFGVSNSLNSPSVKPAAIRLTNTQVHKEELLKKLLSRSESSSDLQIGVSQKGGSSPRPASLPSSPVHASPPRLAAGRKSFSAILERGIRSKAVEAASKPSTNALASESKSTELGKRKRGSTPLLNLRSSTTTSSQETQEHVQTPMTPVATSPEVSGARKESLSRREIHIFSERQRRKGMTHLYTILHSLLPDAKPKTDRCTVLTEAMEYIHELQSRLNELVGQKNEIMAWIGEQLHTNLSDANGELLAQGAAGDNAAESGRLAAAGSVDDLISEEMREEILTAADVVVRLCGRDAFVTLNSPRRNGVWSAILHVFHEKDMELLNVTLSSSNDMDYHCIHAKVSDSELRSSELQKMLQDVVLNHAILE